MVRAQQTFLVFQDVFKTSGRYLQYNNFLSSKMSSIPVCKTSSLRRLAIISRRRLEDILEDKKYYTEDIFKTSSRRL